MVFQFFASCGAVAAAQGRPGSANHAAARAKGELMGVANGFAMPVAHR